MADNRTPVPPSVTTIDPAYVIPSVLPQANTLKTITADNVICSHCKDILSPTHLLRLCVYQKPVEFEICPNRTVLDLKALILRDMGVDHEAETKWEILVKEKGWRDLEEFKSLTLNAASVRSGNIVHVFSRMLGATDFYRNNDKDSSDDQIVFPSIPVITDIDDATHEVNSGLPDMSVPSISKTNTYLTVSDSKPMNVFDATKTLVAVLLTSPDDIDQQTVSKPNTWNSAVLNCKRMDVFDTTKFMYEVLGRLAPFSRMTKNLQRVIGSVKDDECQSRDDATENVSDDCWNLFQQCWVQDTTARPLFRVRLSV
ncbi:hypothetical protein BCR33DRAFT_739169 [Rhizoclosmatium globosum]|uniref:Uncharacterized protein n=1 Tax=Rhizoclosmatium globosum TaxID=329046 RepID=A0A1Y2C6R0_9FUNG|nr:hypothetical protein BCR33DRAFT_739169 [Rhizoclosmatium globosum]|eukprot:ORY42636.1 hypothetical protein BCR33DRAFT_739169 [Rhizoclosmatium globosum]